MMARNAFVPLLLLLTVAAPVAAQVLAPPPKEVAPPKVDAFELVITGQILSDDALDRGRGVPGKVYAVKLRKGKAYVIDLVTTDFDAFLRLEDSTGVQLAEDDDSGGNLNSRIRYTAAKDDTYLIYTTSLGGGEGNYTLSVKSFVAKPVKLIPLPAPASTKPSEIQTKLEIDDPADPVRNYAAKLYGIELKANKTYVFDLISSEFDAFLALQDSNAVTLAQDDDGGGNLNSRIQFRPKADGQYRIVATTFNGQLGAFTLRVAERP
jgi:hypothetical protein